MAAPKPRARIGPKSGPAPGGLHRYRPLIAAGLSGIGPLPGCGHRGGLARNSGGLSAIPALSAPPDQGAGRAIGLATKGRGAPALGKWMGGCPRHSLLFAMAEPDASSVFLALMLISDHWAYGTRAKEGSAIVASKFSGDGRFLRGDQQGQSPAPDPAPSLRSPHLLLPYTHWRAEASLKIIGVFI